MTAPEDLFVTQSGEEENGATRTAGRQKFSDAAVIFSIVAILLTMPPFITLFARSETAYGLSSLTIYLFCIWAALILCAWLISRWYSHQADTPAEPPAAR